MLRVEIAKTPNQLEQGLMYRTKLAEDKGMLFCFANPRRLNFYGRNTMMPLDIAFVDKNNTIQKISFIKSMSEELVSSDDNCLMAIEANLGYFENNGIKEGSRVEIEPQDGSRATITFH